VDLSLNQLKEQSLVLALEGLESSQEQIALADARVDMISLTQEDYLSEQKVVHKIAHL
jgi:hypothetical protein